MQKWLTTIILVLMAVVLVLNYKQQVKVNAKLNYIIIQGYIHMEKSDSIKTILDSVFVDIYEAR